MKASAMKRVLALAAASTALMSAPATAFAVSVSSGDGSGTQSATTFYRCGAYMSGMLKSTNGAPVYYNGDEVIDHGVDIGVGRYTTDTSSKTAVSRGGLLGSPSSCTGGADGFHVKICRNRSYLSDPCGGWATTIRNPL